MRRFVLWFKNHFARRGSEMTRTEKRRQDAILAEWLTENHFTSVDSFLDSYLLIKVTNPQILEDLLNRLRAVKEPV